MARYLSIVPDNEPYDLPLDDKGRAHVVFSVSCEKTVSETFEEEVVGVLVDEGVGEWGVNIFSSSAAVLPAGDGPYLVVNAVGGPGPRYIQNSPVPAYQRPTARVMVRASTYVAARAMARAAYDALAQVRNRTLTPVG